MLRSSDPSVVAKSDPYAQGQRLLDFSGFEGLDFQGISPGFYGSIKRSLGFVCSFSDVQLDALFYSPLVAGRVVLEMDPSNQSALTQRGPYLWLLKDYPRLEPSPQGIRGGFLFKEL